MRVTNMKIWWSLNYVVDKTYFKNFYIKSCVLTKNDQFLTNLSHRINFLQIVTLTSVLYFYDPWRDLSKNGFAGYTETEQNFQVDAQSVVEMLWRCLYPHFIRLEQLDTFLERICAAKYVRTPGTTFSSLVRKVYAVFTEIHNFENWKAWLSFVPYGCI